jgi:hypothetical protein
MRNVAAKAPPKRRGGRRILIILGILVLLIAGGIVFLNVAAQAAVSAAGTLTVYQPLTSTSHDGTSYTRAVTGAVIRGGDWVKTDASGRAAVTLPDGTITRLASNTALQLDSAHFTRSGNMHDVKLVQQVGRTFTNVQHLVSGSSFDVQGKSATASVRGTKFEVYIKPDGTMIVKVWSGTVTLHNATGSVDIHAGQQATVGPDGTIGPAGPITADPDDPFGPGVDASNAVEVGTTLGTEQDYVGAPLHNGETQTYSYSYAGGNLVKSSLGYAGSLMKLTVKAPDGQSYSGSGKSPIVVVINSAPGGIYMITATGVSGLGTNGEEPFVAVASLEDCKSADIAQNGAVHRGYTSDDLVKAVESSGLSGVSNLSLTINGDSAAGAIIDATGTFDGFPWSGSVVLVAQNGTLNVMPTSGKIFGLNVPAQQLVQQVGTAIGQDPSKVNPGFVVDRLFTCSSVLIIDGHLPAA